MKNIVAVSFLFFIISKGVSAQNINIDNSLFELPDVVFKKIDSSASEITYKLLIKQPLDHSKPSENHFYQKAILKHRDISQPMVMITEGYRLKEKYDYELTDLLNANEINIEHRFFGESVPDSLNYKHLNFKQISADLHHINTLFKKIYKGKWVSTGMSKGGQTSIFYRYFYPEDVDVSIPCVAPLNYTYDDSRIHEFLNNTIGTSKCRKKVKNFQKQLLINRDEILPKLMDSYKDSDMKFTYLTPEQAYEYLVLDYPFAFWQYGYGCEKIPGKTSSVNDMVEYIKDISSIKWFSDKLIDYFLPLYYQSATELGYYGYKIEDFDGLIKELTLKDVSNTRFLPKNMDVTFDETLLTNVHKWLKEEGNRFIYIYGELDTWTANAVPINSNVDSEWFFMKGMSHQYARINNLNAVELERLKSILENWLSIKITNTLPDKK